MSTPAQSSPRLVMTGVHKRFGATVALGGVDFTVHPGEVHALVGENGAGKSTLMKILSGAEQPDAGRISLDGTPFLPRNPLAARRAGVAMIYQELNLAPHLTVEANLTLGVEAHRWGVIRPRRHRARIRRVLQMLHRPAINLHTPVADLGPADRQLVEIARALLNDARVIVMDEPTSSLGLADIEHLFQVINTLRETGAAIIYISHFLEEIQRIADRYTVLRDGQSVATGSLRDTTLDTLVTHMIGRKLEQLFPRIARTTGDPLLEIDGLAGRRLPIDASLTLHRGEILGLAGLVGAGRTELLRALFGLDPVRRGEVRIAHVGPRAAATPHARLRQGVGLLSEDRQNEGLALAGTIADNVTLSRLPAHARFGFVRLANLHAAAQRWISALDIRCRGSQQPVRALSGGNQQKVALARLLHQDVDILLLDEPTRGVDVGSKAQIYALIGRLAQQGKSVIMVSSYVPELLGTCDRIGVMHRGRIVATRATGEWTEHAIITAAAGGHESSS